MKWNSSALGSAIGAIAIASFLLVQTHCNDSTPGTPDAGTSSTDGGNEENLSTLTGQALTMGADNLDTITAAIEAVKLKVLPWIEQDLNLSLPTSVEKVCDDGNEPEAWRAYCWVQVDALQIGTTGISGYTPATFSGRIGWKVKEAKDATSLTPDGVLVQVALKEDDVAEDPQELYFNLLLDWYNGLSEATGSGTTFSLLNISSPDNVMSYNVKKDNGRLSTFCTNYQTNKDTIVAAVTKAQEASSTTYGDGALALFDTVCAQLDKVPSTEGKPVTTFMLIKQLSLIGNEYRGSFVMGKSLDKEDLRSNLVYANVYWGYPVEGNEEGAGPRSRVLVKFTGTTTVTGVSVTLQKPEEAGQCYVLDYTQGSVQAALAKIEAGEAPEASLTTAKCPLACLLDAECDKGNLCDPTNNVCVPGCKKDDECPTTQKCEGEPGELPDTKTCVSVLTSCNDTDNPCTIPGYVCFKSECSYGCRDNTDCTVEGKHCTPHNAETELGSCDLQCGGDHGDCLTGQVCELGFCLAGCTAENENTACASYQYCDTAEGRCKGGCRDGGCTGGKTCCKTVTPRACLKDKFCPAP
jgi:hypothetical protein